MWNNTCSYSYRNYTWFMAYLVIDLDLYEKNNVAIQFVSLIPAVIVGAVCAVILVKMSKKNEVENNIY